MTTAGDQVEGRRHAEPETYERLERLASVGMFATGIMHELVNPLASIRAALAHAAETADTGGHERLLEAIALASDRCQRVVEGLMGFVRDGIARKAPTLAGGMLHRAIRSVQSDFGAELLRVRLDATAERVVFPCNAPALEQVFVNLLRNAVEASGPDGVSVCIDCSSDDDSVTFSFRDDGPGIPAADLERVFEPFCSTRQDRSGRGLGLALSRQIVIAHGGTIRALPDQQRGATIALRLPLGGG